ncbi:MAG: prepilin-type N-terminal cleavage/methylation domain-containing protein [Candidatus Gracilibacteria bacterium]|nr:prepilin-type N-terminal cleavage/methylation domain-containing protein [Candidatus Gracilibacteria bacterium]
MEKRSIRNKIISSLSRENKKGFTLIELIVVVVILSVLATISFIGYLSNMSSARDTTRKSDAGKIKQALNEFKSATNNYPFPKDYLAISNSGTSNQTGSTNIYALQGILSDKFDINGSFMVPKDPKINKSYLYSITGNRKDFQIGSTLENGGRNIAYIEGSFKTVSKDYFPSLLIAASGSGIVIEIHSGTLDGAENRKKFIVSGGSYNLPYDFATGGIVNNPASYDSIVNETGVMIPKATNYTSCSNIYENGKYLGPGQYQVHVSTGTITIDCTNWSCGIRPSYAATYYDGSISNTNFPRTFDGIWQNIDENSPCYYKCTNLSLNAECN